MMLQRSLQPLLRINATLSSRAIAASSGSVTIHHRQCSIQGPNNPDVGHQYTTPEAVGHSSNVKLQEKDRQGLKSGKKIIKIFNDMTVFQLAYKLDLHPKIVWSSLRERGVDVENFFTILGEQEAMDYITERGHTPKRSTTTNSARPLPARFKNKPRTVTVFDKMTVRQLANRLNLDRAYIKRMLEREGVAKKVQLETILTLQQAESFVDGMGHIPRPTEAPIVAEDVTQQKLQNKPNVGLTASSTAPDIEQHLLNTLSAIEDNTELLADDLSQNIDMPESVPQKDSVATTQLTPDPSHTEYDEEDPPTQLTALESRPPIVTVMGHVDHGKTTLLDSLRQTSVAASEAGGITQHIGAFTVWLSSGQQITFLDTPGHAAFTAMRARGASCTDIVVLVVAADDGIMQQTVESIRLIKEAGVPMVVAINKCDKPGVNPDRVKSDLLNHGVQLEEFGGEVQAVQVSALKGTGLESLEEAILVLAEISDLEADPKNNVEGVVIETKVDKGLGPVSTVIVQEGTLRAGDVLVAGQSWGKMRKLLDQNRRPLKEAPPSTPVLTVGWKDLPAAGDEVTQVANEQTARDLCVSRATSSRAQLERAKLRERGQETDEERGVVPLVVRGDVAGSVEVLVELLQSRQPEELELNVIHTGVGSVTEGDIEMTASTGGYLLAFNVGVSKGIQALAKSRSVTIISHNVIYKLVDLLKEQLAAKLPPVWVEEVVGEAIVLRVFKLTGARRASVGGCRVKQGRLVRNALYRLVRDGETIHEGSLSGLKLGREDIEVARKETECGVSFSTDPGFQEGDQVVCFNKEKRLAELNWDLGF